MKNIIGYALVIVAAMTSASFANSGSSPSDSAIDRVLHGHGSSGEVVVPASNGDVSYKVLENGTIQKINRRYSTVEMVNPHWPASASARPAWVGR